MVLLSEKKLESWEKICQECDKVVSLNHKHCPKCSASPEHYEIRNYDMMWHDGDIHCGQCGEFIRSFDAG